MMTSITPKHIRKTLSSILVATSEPTIFPIITGIDRSSPCFRLKVPLRKKFIVAVKFCRKTAIRFVPLAIVIGRPSAVNIVTVTTEPPPARVFIAPTMIPETINMMVMLKSNSIYPPINLSKIANISENYNVLPIFAPK